MRIKDLEKVRKDRAAVKSTKNTIVDRDGRFTPEFSGVKSYERTNYVMAQCDHGRVVNALYSRLSALGFAATNDGPRDLFVASEKMLFEIKSGSTPYDIYTAVGQLMVNGLGKKGWRKLFVVAPAITDALKEALRRLGLAHIEYHFAADEVVFRELETALKVPSA